MRTIYQFTIVSSLFLLVRCAEVPSWNDEKCDSVPPGMVSNPVVENTSGGAIITYSLPADDDLFAVKATYSLTEEGETLESYSSSFKSKIELKGFPDTKSRAVKLTCIDKSKNESQPVEVVVQPLTPPVEIIRQSLIVQETFGGVLVGWENANREDIGISLFAEDSLGHMNLDHT